MTSHLGKYVRRQRERQGLNRGQLARSLGYRNISKGVRRILDLETQGSCAARLWARVQDVLGLDQSDIEHAASQDWADYQAWLDQPVPMELVLKLIPAVYLNVRLPAEARSDEVKAETYACEVAEARKLKACLVVSRRLSIWINEKGEVYSRTSPSLDRANRPYMELGRKRFLLGVGK